MISWRDDANSNEFCCNQRMLMASAETLSRSQLALKN
jgi:hypothetical protein